MMLCLFQVADMRSMVSQLASGFKTLLISISGYSAPPTGTMRVPGTHHGFRDSETRLIVRSLASGIACLRIFDSSSDVFENYAESFSVIQVCAQGV